jgi:hypothetical protein
MRLLTALLAVLLLVTPHMRSFAAARSGYEISCNQNTTDGCGYVDTSDSDRTRTPKSLIAADGWVFSMFNNGNMLRCNQGSNLACVTFNTLMSGGGPMAILRPGTIIATSGNIMVRS